jgi:hypothetical protein
MRIASGARCMSDQVGTAVLSIAEEFEADLAADVGTSDREHSLVANLRAILEGPNGHSIGSLACVVEQLLAELSIGQSAIGGHGDEGLSAYQIEELGSVLLDLERERAEEAFAVQTNSP